MATTEKFTSEAPPELLAAMRGIAQKEGRQFEAVVEDAMWEYLEGKLGPDVRPEVTLCFEALVADTGEKGKCQC